MIKSTVLSMALFVNIHSHKTNVDKESQIQLVNVMLHNQNIPVGEMVSAGWHPWFIQSFSITEIESRLERAVRAPNVIAIGECGLDRAIDIPFAFQIQVFKLHLKFAIENNKPMVIHCVKAYSDLLSVLKNEKFGGKIILHGFRGTLQQVIELQKFNACFSFGKSLVSDEPKHLTVFRSIRVSKIFLETDDSSYSIEEIYIRAAEIRSADIEELKGCLETNFIEVFNKI